MPTQNDQPSMRVLDPTCLTERENYKMLIGGIIPRPIAFVTSLSPTGVVNGAPFSYFSIVSAAPPRLSLAVQRDRGRAKDTARNIKALGEFVVHVVDSDNVAQVNRTAAPLPPDRSEIAAGLSLVPSSGISVPGICEAKIRMECRLERAVELAGAGSPACDLLIGRVVRYHVRADIYARGKIDPLRLAAVGRLAGADYATIGRIFALQRPQSNDRS